MGNRWGGGHRQIEMDSETSWSRTKFAETIIRKDAFACFTYLNGCSEGFTMSRPPIHTHIAAPAAGVASIMQGEEQLVGGYCLDQGRLDPTATS